MSPIAPFLDAFRRAAALLDSPELASLFSDDTEDVSEQCRQIAVIGLVVAARQLRAIALLLEHDLYIEAEPLIRSLVEHAITLAWVGRDSARADLYRAQGLGSLRRWVNSMCDIEPDYFSARALEAIERVAPKGITPKVMPNLLARAQQPSASGFGNGLIERAYHFAYRRLSVVTHADAQVADLLANPVAGHSLVNARDAAVAAAILIDSAGQSLNGVAPAATTIAADLYSVAKASQKRPATDE